MDSEQKVKSLESGGMSAEEAEDQVVKLGKEGVLPSRIGLVMRDQYAVPNVKKVTGKSVKQILDAHGIKPGLPEDLTGVILKAVKLYGHYGRNPRDLKIKRSIEMTEARVNKLAGYYKREGVLPSDWRYDRERAALLVRK